MIEFTRFQLPIGKLSILAVKEGVVKISFKNESQVTLEKWCRNHLNMGMRKGMNFTTEARNMHYDKKTSKGIYGKATPEETSELIEEGIEVTTIPWIDKSEN